MKKLIGVVALVVAAVSGAYAEDPPVFLLKWGSIGSGDGQFRGTNQLAVDPAGNLYVTENDNNRIQKFTNNGTFLTKWGSGGSGDGQFFVPFGVTVDANGNVYVSDSGNHRIQKFTSSGAFLTKWGSPGTGDGQFQFPNGVAVDGSGNVYVADVLNHRIQKFTSDGTFITKWGSCCSGDGRFFYPRGIAVDGNGNVYVSDSGNHRIQKFTSDGVFLTKWGTYGTDDGQFKYPAGVAVDASGNVYVADTENHRVQKFTSDGKFLAKWGSEGSGDGKFLFTHGVGVDTNGNVYSTDWGNSRIQKFGLPPVVLVHGICSDASVWTDFATYLTQRGFSVYTPSLTPNNSRPHELAAQLDALFEQIGTGKVNVVAHSMGGIVSRYYVRGKREGSRIASLITLGTPHHGSDLATYAFKKKTISRIVAKLSDDLTCKAVGPGLYDLTTGSPSLNLLNYDTVAEVDKLHKLSRGNHDPEVVYDPSLRIWAIAGTRGFLGPALEATRLVWSDNIGSYFTQDYQNDGNVGVDAAKMYNSTQATSLVDVNVGLFPLQHTPTFWAYFGTNAFRNAPDLFGLMENLLRGGIPPPAPPAPLLAPQAVTAAPIDTVVSIILSTDGQLPSGQTVEQPFTIPTTARCQVTMAADSALFRLRTPSGTVLTPADTLTVPGLSYVEEPTIGLAVYTMDNPQPGTWTAVIDCSVSPVGQKYAVSAEIITTRQIRLELAVYVLYTPGTTPLRMSVRNVGTSIAGTSWTIVVTKPDSTTLNVTAFDDGAHGDSLVADGIFGADIPLLGPVGQYRVDVQATVLSDSSTFVDATAFELITFQDLAVDSTLSFSRNSVMVGDSLQISATIQNLGNDPVQNVRVEFRDNSTMFAVDSLGLSGNGSGVVSATWTAASPDTHVIRVTVYPFTLPSEANYANNSTTKLVVLGQPIVGVAEQLANLRFWLGLAVPNPTTGKITVRFTLPERLKTSFEIFDVLGRRIKAWQWEDLPAGNHQVQWDGQKGNGQTASPGMYLYRLRAGAHFATKKVVRIR